MTKDNGKYDTTSTERMRRRREELRVMAKSLGYESHDRLLSVMLQAHKSGRLFDLMCHLTECATQGD